MSPVILIVFGVFVGNVMMLMGLHGTIDKFSNKIKKALEIINERPFEYSLVYKIEMVKKILEGE